MHILKEKGKMMHCSNLSDPKVRSSRSSVQADLLPVHLPFENKCRANTCCRFAHNELLNWRGHGGNLVSKVVSNVGGGGEKNTLSSFEGEDSIFFYSKCISGQTLFPRKLSLQLGKAAKLVHLLYTQGKKAYQCISEIKSVDFPVFLDIGLAAVLNPFVVFLFCFKCS